MTTDAGTLVLDVTVDGPQMAREVESKIRMMDLAPITVPVKADTRGLGKDVQTGFTKGMKNFDPWSSMDLSSKFKKFESKTGLSAFSRMGPSLSSTVKTGATGAIVALGGFGAYSVKVAGDFDQTMKTMAAVADVPAAGIARLTGLAKQMGADTAFSSNQAAEAMLELAKSGLSVEDIMGGALADTLDLAAAGDIELAEAATITANAMNTFNLKGGESKQVADALAGGANTSSADVRDLALALSQAGAGAAAADYKIQETVGALAAFADNGIKGSDAGTSLKTMMLSLVPATDTAAKTMKSLGIDFTDAKGNIAGVTEVAAILQEKVGGLTKAEQQLALKKMFGNDAFRAANVLMKQGESGMRKYIDGTYEVGAAHKVGEARMNTFKGSMEKLQGSFETVALQVGEALMPTLKEMFDDLAGWLNENGDEITEWANTILFFLEEMMKKAKWFFEGLGSLNVLDTMKQDAEGDIENDRAIKGMLKVFTKNPTQANADTLRGMIEEGGPAAMDYGWILDVLDRAGFDIGGYIPPTPGGRIIKVAESGQGEWVFNEDQMDRWFGGSKGDSYTRLAQFNPEDGHWYDSEGERSSGTGSLGRSGYRRLDDYRNGRWYDSEGKLVGFAKTEDSEIRFVEREPKGPTHPPDPSAGTTQPTAPMFSGPIYLVLKDGRKFEVFLETTARRVAREEDYEHDKHRSRVGGPR